MPSVQTLIALYSQVIISIIYSLALTLLNRSTNTTDNEGEHSKSGFYHIYFFIFVYFLMEIPFLIYYFIKHKQQPSATTLDDLSQVSSFVNNEFTPDIDDDINEYNAQHVDDNKDKEQRNSNVNARNDINCFIFAFPALFDFVSKVCIYNGLLFISNNNTLIQPFVSVLIATVVAFVFEKHIKISKMYIIVIIYFIGFACIIAAFILSGIEGNKFKNIYALCLIVFGEGFKIGHFYMQEVLIIKKGEQISVKQVGYEGMFGLMYSALLLIVMCLMYDESRLVVDDMFLIGENITQIVSDIGKKTYLYVVLVGLVCSFMFYNVIGLNVIRKRRSLFGKVLMDNLKVGVLAVYYCLTYSGVKHKGVVMLLNVVGFVVMGVAANVSCGIFSLCNVGDKSDVRVKQQIENMKDNFLF